MTTATESLRERGEHLAQTQSAALKPDENVKEEIGGFGADAIVRFCVEGPSELVGLFANLCANGLGTTVEETFHVAGLARRVTPRSNFTFELERKWSASRRRVDLVERRKKAAFGPRVAARSCGVDEVEKRVAVAVDENVMHRHHVAARGAFDPQLGA